MNDSKGLSARECEILVLVAKGASNKEIAQELHISTNTVKVHLRNIFTKIDANSRTEAAMYAVNSGLVNIETKEKIEQKEPKRRILQSPFFIGFGLVALVLIISTLIASLVTLNNETNMVMAGQPLIGENQRWQNRAPMTEARKGLALVAYAGYIYAIGGETEQSITGRVERYDPNLDMWTNLATKPVPVSDASAAVIGGKIYVPGGRNGSNKIENVLEIYSPGDDVWERGADLPTSLSAYALVSYEGYLYLFGGWDGHKIVNSVYQYSPELNLWRELTPMPTARSFLGASVMQGKINVLGGYDGEKALSTNEIYIPELEGGKKSPWGIGEPLPNPRYAMGVASLVDTMQIFGGIGDLEGPLPSLVYSNRSESWEVYESPFDNQWSQLGLVTIGSNLYLVGGEINGSLTRENLTYRAIYTINMPIIR